jgi:DNA-binding response OmpR family regulator
MSSSERRHTPGPDRRSCSRGGRRSTDQPGRCPTIAIVDQYEAARTPCARYLDHFNFNVLEAATAEQGFALLETVRPAAMLIEEKRTAEFLRLRHEARIRAIPVLALTIPSGQSEEPATESPDGVLVKPFSLGLMLEELRRLLRTPMTPPRGLPS